MGDHTGQGGGRGDDPIPFAGLPEPKNKVAPVAIAAFVGALIGAVVGVQLG